MWTLAGQGWWRGRALAAWVTEAARMGLLGPHLASRAPDRWYSSADRKEKIDMSCFPVENIRNFSIIAHVDHGKSTLADRLLELTGAIAKTKNNKQVLDKLQVERERGITVKAQTASLFYNHEGKQYLLNLIDTPGHVDFSYEVSRSLSACQGVLLVVDANEGIQAQTVANFFLAFEAQLSIIPVINKIDLKNADPERVEKQIEKVFDIPGDECIKISAKLGTNVESVLDAVIKRIPFPKAHCRNPLRALVFDSTFDQYRGVIANVALFDGVVSKGDKIVSAHTQKTYEVNEVGVLNPNEQPTHKLYAGQVGYLIAGMKDVTEAQIGDTLYLHKQPVEPLPGFKSAKPMVFAGVYPIDQSEYNNLKSAIEKLTLNDSSVTVHRDSSLALGAGWRLGFLGLLHMEVFNQRLEQEYHASVILTTPTVPYKAVLSSAKLIKEYREKEITIINPAQFPDKSKVIEYLEPVVLGTIITPDEYTGKIMMLCQARRAVQKNMMFIDQNRVMLKYLFPLNEIVVDFYDSLKSLSSGYASFDYEDAGYQTAELVKMDILLNGNIVEELVTVVHKDKAYSVGKAICERLKDSLPRQLFEIAIQAALGSKIIARETVKAYRKNVLAKCYGGDITRKMKLLKRQAEGKKKLRKVGNVEVPKDAFIKVLKTQTDCMAAGTRPAAAPRSRASMAQWKKKKGLRKRRGAASQSRSSDSEDGEFEIQAEDDARAQKLAPGRPLPTFPTSECTSDVEPDTREMVRAQNKKKKKSGGFQSMGLSYPVFKGIMKKGYKVPTPIQRKTIPMILDGKDVVAMARTGSGKTACFLIPMFERLKTHSAQTGARALILSPTRELALQTMKFTKELGKFTGLKTALILGGDKMEDQFAALHENPDIIIATPGRLVHVAVEMNLKLQSVEYVVFDEADRLFEMGFAEQLQEIIGRLPGGHQTVLFSATLPKLLVEFARAGLTEPVLIRLDVDSKLNEQLKTSFFLVREDAKAAVLLHLLRNVVRPQDQTVVFVATKHHAEYLSELLATQGVSCAHVYSALDQTARKINLARFTHGKCSALIVTDLAARGLDIPLLDNVINYSFPAKGKLFLHRVGRVARAGRSGTAYSLVAPDEVPYLLDLHLFLGRALTLARPPEEPSGTEGGDGVLGRVPQGVVDDEDCGLRTSLEASLELRGLSRVADNAQQQYVRSRPAPSPESIKRAKELDLAGLGLHPLFSSRFQQEELQRLRLVDSIRNYRSRATIFEINASSRDLSSQVMRAKREKDRKAIASFQQGRQELQERQEGLAPSLPAPQEEQAEKEEAAGESVEDVFTEVVSRKRQQPGPHWGAKRRREEARQRDQAFYIPYRPKDFDSERGLSVGGDGGAFEQQVAGAVLDLMGDEAQSLTRGRQQLKWDRKKKRFVGQSGQEDKKKIKTESGRYISSSYKRDLYQKWKQKQKIDDRDSEEEGISDRRGPERRGGKRGRGQGASQPRTPGTPTGRVRSELKTKQQILKQRRRAQKMRFLQRGGLKQLSARNRRRAQELQQGAFGRGAPSKKGKMRKRM